MIKGFDSIGFGMGERVNEIKYGDSVDVVCEINLNEFNGSRKLELRLVDLKKVSSSASAFAKATADRKASEDKEKSFSLKNKVL